jgi:dihydrofolate reductase
VTSAAVTGSRTGSVVIQAAMSVDGFIAGPGDSMDWVFEFTAPASFPEIIAATGAMLSGRTSYEVGERDVGKPSGDAYGGAWNGPMFVLTHRPPAAGRPGMTFLSGDIATAVATAKQAAGDKDLVVLGADVGRQALERGLVDEIQLMILPVLLGDGTRLYGSADGTRVDLELAASQQSGGVTLQTYRVRK